MAPESDGLFPSPTPRQAPSTTTPTPRTSTRSPPSRSTYQDLQGSLRAHADLRPTGDRLPLAGAIGDLVPLLLHYNFVLVNLLSTVIRDGRALAAVTQAAPAPTTSASTSCPLASSQCISLFAALWPALVTAEPLTQKAGPGRLVARSRPRRRRATSLFCNLDNHLSVDPDGEIGMPGIAASGVATTGGMSAQQVCLPIDEYPEHADENSVMEKTGSLPTLRVHGDLCTLINLAELSDDSSAPSSVAMDSLETSLHAHENSDVELNMVASTVALLQPSRAYVGAAPWVSDINLDASDQRLEEPLTLAQHQSRDEFLDQVLPSGVGHGLDAILWDDLFSDVVPSNRSTSPAAVFAGATSVLTFSSPGDCRALIGASIAHLSCLSGMLYTRAAA
jgi:hypothetical protein